MKDVDDLAQFIRCVDGSHTMGAGALAEAIVSYQLEAMFADDVIERVADVLERMDGMDLEDQARAVLTAALGIEGDE